jgi:hypothetical protein
MRERRFHGVGLLVFTGLMLAVNTTSAAVVRWTVAHWLGHEMVFSFDANNRNWFALAGAGQETKPGNYLLKLHAERPSGPAISFEKKIRIEPRRYPRVLLKVPERYTAPSPEDQREIEQDKEIKAEVFKTTSPGREWKGSFRASGECCDLRRVWSRARLQRFGREHASGARFPRAQWNSVAAVNRGRVILARASVL